jgi:hypothetical protein
MPLWSSEDYSTCVNGAVIPVPSPSTYVPLPTPPLCLLSNMAIPKIDPIPWLCFRYSDATGAGCWARLLVQNVGWGYSATISWYLIGAFTRGMDYDSDGLLRAEWPVLCCVGWRCSLCETAGGEGVSREFPHITCLRTSR